MTTALLLVDVQRNMLEGSAPVPSATALRAVLDTLLRRARDVGALVVHVQNDGSAGDPDVPLTSGWELVFPVRPDELLVRKQVQDTFARPELAATLQGRGVDRVVVAGMQSNYCIAATSRGALRHGFAVVLAAGAHATYNERDPAEVISARVEAELHGEGVAVLPAEEIRFA